MQIISNQLLITIPMKKPAAGTAGKVEIHAINLGPSAGGNQSLVSQEVLDLESRPILNKEKIHTESEARPSQKTWQQPSQGGGARRQSSHVSASSTDQQCLTGTLLGLHRQGQRRGWNAQHYQRIAEAHWDRYPMGYWLWMHCARGVQ